MDKEYFKMEVEPGRMVFGRQMDYLAFERIGSFPESGWFVATSSEWGLPKLCQVVPAERVRPRDGKPRYISEDGDLLPVDAAPFGRLVYGCILFDKDLKGA